MLSVSEIQTSLQIIVLYIYVFVDLSMAMVNGNHENLPSMQHKSRNTTRKKVSKSNTFNTAVSSSLPTSPVSPRRRPSKQLPPEPRLTKAVYLLMEAKRLARELEGKKVAGSFFRPFTAKQCKFSFFEFLIQFGFQGIEAQTFPLNFFLNL